MKVTVAKSAGFCFGVKRAVSECYEQAEHGERPIYTYGPIIHNEQVVEDLEKKGVHVLENEEMLRELHTGTVIIRSHGVSKQEYEKIAAQGVRIVDATCPFVKKIHRIVQEKSREGYEIVIIGNAKHPEVQGICGWAGDAAVVLETEDEVHDWCNARKSERPVCVVSQTTFHARKFDKLVEIIRQMSYDGIAIMNTICNATEERQNEAAQLSEQSDAMIVIGGRNSSNTQKLFEICKEKCKNTFYVQTLSDLNIRLLPSKGCVGITAGASTPNKLIEEVSKQCQK